MMSSKERFAAALSHREPDRVPIDYLASPQADAAVKKYYDINTETELLDILGSDFYYLSCRDISQNESCLPFYRGSRAKIDGERRICPFGIEWQRGAYDSKFAVDDSIQGPLKNAQSESDILEYSWPEVSEFDFSAFGSEIEANRGRVIVGGFWSGILGDCYRMMGFENFLLNIALKPDMVKTLINRMTDFYLEMNNSLFTLFKGKIDIWFFGNDFGSQSGLLFSREMIEEFFVPGIRVLSDNAKSHGLNVMMHSCGAISEVVPMFIDAGVEIIDPVQVTAVGMDPQSLKDSCGDKVTFHGGIDTQHLLPNEDAQRVYAESRRIIDIMSAGGGYIFAPSQILGGDIPAENIDAMYRAARSC
ncbi:methylcobalamin:coenzyme M methyltransferase [Limihaloglobus sulfuriphilus]|uniref:Methylcobalamin:coenzyme M methyltransferase n=1 Tax=Limihaloglobus sulfuriphilus TaxID=1851148 RepID=A0A1Q2MBN3_9BACT|nr:uroporphyrinogen decarboxylase family protein [Limihaloglobus sulfuriphilus]AQQ70091.1 methylcobalamin:coenzyme M methyltransferase [Limihaloglobus sulfuriphilus]